MSVDLIKLHDAIEEGIKKKVGAYATVEIYPAISRRIACPSVLIELHEMHFGDDPGNGETAIIGRFQARVVIDPNVPKAMAIVCALSAKVAAAIKHETWGMEISAAQMISEMGEDSAKPELDGYIVWLIEWQHYFDVGENSCELIESWNTSGQPPGGGQGGSGNGQSSAGDDDERDSTIMIGIYPETGNGKDPRYWEMGESPPDDWGESKP